MVTWDKMSSALEAIGKYSVTRASLPPSQWPWEAGRVRSSRARFLVRSSSDKYPLLPHLLRLTFYYFANHSFYSLSSVAISSPHLPPSSLPVLSSVITLQHCSSFGTQQRWIYLKCPIMATNGQHGMFSQTVPVGFSDILSSMLH